MTFSFDYAAIGRILIAAVGDEASIPIRYRRPPNGAPGDDFASARLARAKLASSISWAFSKCDIIENLGSDAAARRRYESLKKISRYVHTIQEIMADNALLSSISGHLPQSSDVINELRNLREAADVGMKRLKKAGLNETAPLKKAKDDGKAGKPALIGEFAKIYADTFDEDASISYNSLWEPRGPFIQFAEAIFAETGNPMNPDAIRRNWERSRPQDKGA